MEAQDRIRQLMDDRGWSEYRLSKESGLAQSTIANIFRRNNSPTLPTLEAVCKAFGITLTQFFSKDSALIELTENQIELLQKWSVLSDEQKKLFLALMDTMKRNK
ncbi:helix-turn-helix domain-containing protein [Hungatella effluvii]|uniref:helix-turn-helix domain-containing protein n=1 Tax=Hungatella effluvii TaxID=1096246 RepID=UPI0022E7335C|nr:helix-turn-helix transcriptional regulator [Hungatella effluvii]